MVERVRNVIITLDRKRLSSTSGFLSENAATKKSKNSAETNKRDVLVRRYPTGIQLTEDSASTKSHLAGMCKELAKGKPRDYILLPLMKSTYPSCRLFILNDATSVQHILKEYPALQRQAVVRIGAACSFYDNYRY